MLVKGKTTTVPWSGRGLWAGMFGLSMMIGGGCYGTVGVSTPGLGDAGDGWLGDGDAAGESTPVGDSAGGDRHGDGGGDSGGDAGAPPNWLAVQHWAYQLTGYSDDKLDEIVASGFELVVIDLARDGYLDFFSSTEVAAARASGKILLAYFEIGAIEAYRPEWGSVPSELKLGAVDGWPDEQYVAYWDEQWWPIVESRTQRALDAGFAGAYLDMVVTYEEIPANAAGTNRVDLARKMVALIERLSIMAKAQNPAFKVVPQNSPELGVAGFIAPGYDAADASRYLAVVDGLGVEELYYQATDRPCDAAWCEENRDNTGTIANAGKLVLTVDYANQAGHVTDAYQRSRAAGFVPYCSVVALDVLRINAGLDPP